MRMKDVWCGGLQTVQRTRTTSLEGSTPPLYAWNFLRDFLSWYRAARQRGSLASPDPTQYPFVVKSSNGFEAVSEDKIASNFTHTCPIFSSTNAPLYNRVESSDQSFSYNHLASSTSQLLYRCSILVSLRRIYPLVLELNYLSQSADKVINDPVNIAGSSCGWKSLRGNSPFPDYSTRTRPVWILIGQSTAYNAQSIALHLEINWSHQAIHTKPNLGSMTHWSWLASPISSSPPLAWKYSDKLQK